MFNSQNMKTSNKKGMRTQYLGIGLYIGNLYFKCISKEMFVYITFQVFYLFLHHSFLMCWQERKQTNVIKFITLQIKDSKSGHQGRH